MTKIMSILLVTEAIEQGKINWDVLLPSADMPQATALTDLPRKRKDEALKISIKEWLSPGNDATVALAEVVASVRNISSN